MIYIHHNPNGTARKVLDSNNRWVLIPAGGTIELDTISELGGVVCTNKDITDDKPKRRTMKSNKHGGDSE